jgi:spore maturation protein CgeB
MAQGMARLLDDAALRQQITQRAYDYVRAEHDVAEMGMRYLTQFERVLAERGEAARI